MYNKTKEQRKAWWNSLTQEQRAAFISKKEHERDTPDRKPLDVVPLTVDEMKAINATMRRIGLADHMVLRDKDGKFY